LPVLCSDGPLVLLADLARTRRHFFESLLRFECGRRTLASDVELAMRNLDRITIDPQVMNGQPTIRGMRLTVRRVLHMLAIYPDWQRLNTEYPELELEDVRQALEFAARNVPAEITLTDAA
jgi:uncharacterized protein (DUF433 family)